MREIVRNRIATEGLRPLAARTGVPLGQLRSLLKGCAARYTTLTSIASAFGLELYVGPARQGSHSGRTVPPEISKALDLPLHATLAEAVGAIERDRVAAKLRDSMRIARSLTERAAEAAAVIPGLIAGAPPRALVLPLVRVRLAPAASDVLLYESTHLSILVAPALLPASANAGRLACLHAANDVMEPEIHRGDLVVIDQDQSVPADDQLYAVATREGVVIERLRQIVEGQLHLPGDEPDGPSRPMRPHYRILGRVIWCEPHGDVAQP